MRQHYYLTQKEKYVITSRLSEHQKQTLKIFSKLSKESYFANVLASHKGTNRYSFEGYLDHGCVDEQIKCLCGKSLRYEFTLKERTTGEIISLGSTHFQREMNIPEHIAKEVVEGINQINLEINEILYKVWQGGNQLPSSLEKYITKIDLPKEIVCLREAGLPLLSRHIDYLFDATKSLRLSTKNKSSAQQMCNEFQSILDGTLDANVYIEKNYGNSIEIFLLKRQGYEPMYNIIEHLIYNHGLKNQMKNGSHILYYHFKSYLDNHPNYFGRPGEYGIKFKHVKYLTQKRKNQEANKKPFIVEGEGVRG